MPSKRFDPLRKVADRHRPRKRRNISLRVTAEEDRALNWKARQRGLRLYRGRYIVGPLLRDESLKDIVDQYHARAAFPDGGPGSAGAR